VKTNHFEQEGAEVAEAVASPWAPGVLLRVRMNVPIGLLINFHALRLADGVHRLVLTGADR
jgi:hypothetical protein